MASHHGRRDAAVAGAVGCANRRGLEVPPRLMMTCPCQGNQIFQCFDAKDTSNNNCRSVLSLVRMVRCSLRSPRFVTSRGTSSVRPNRHCTRPQESEHVPRAMERRRKRRPKSGWVGSMTSISGDFSCCLGLAVTVKKLMHPVFCPLIYR